MSRGWMCFEYRSAAKTGKNAQAYGLSVGKMVLGTRRLKSFYR